MFRIETSMHSSTRHSRQFNGQRIKAPLMCSSCTFTSSTTITLLQKTSRSVNTWYNFYLLHLQAHCAIRLLVQTLDYTCYQEGETRPNANDKIDAMLDTITCPEPIKGSFHKTWFLIRVLSRFTRPPPLTNVDTIVQRVVRVVYPLRRWLLLLFFHFHKYRMSKHFFKYWIEQKIVKEFDL